MLIECLIKREGPTIVSVEKMDYVFTSRPHLSGGDEEAQICEVISASHSAYFLRIPGGLYRQYEKKSKTAQLKPDANDNPDADALTKEKFLTMKNAPQVKSAIKKCNDIKLLNELGQIESNSETRRQWVIDSLSKRLEELEA